MTDSTRARRIAGQIQIVIAQTLERRIKDPRLGFVTITDVRISGDLRQATVYYTVYGDEAARATTAAAFESAKGVLRGEVSRYLRVRFTPSLIFMPDAVPEDARRVESLITQTAAADAGDVCRGMTPVSPPGDPLAGYAEPPGEQKGRDKS